MRVFPNLVACKISSLGLRDYSETYAAMRDFTATRDDATQDELWLVEHPPIFTQGQAGKPEHILAPGDIPIVQSNRGGQVTYHGPGQAVVYVLLDLQRAGYGIRSLVTRIEQAIVATLAGYGIDSFARADAPGVYVQRAVEDPDTGLRKIGSLGLRVSRGCSYHGLSLNVSMDLEPFTRINPCGLNGMVMTQVVDLGGPSSLDRVHADLSKNLLAALEPAPASD